MFFNLLFIFFTISIFSSDIKFPKPKREYWPTEEWKIAKPEKFGVNSIKLNKAFEYAFQKSGDDKNRTGIRTNSVVIIKNGYLIAEKYSRGYTENKKHHSWSIAKAFVNTLFGIAEKEGLVYRSDFAYKFFPTLNTQEKKEIKIEHLLNMSSGIDWNEGYEASPLESSVIQMLYTIGRNDMALYTAEKPMKYKPGTFNYYSSGDSNLLMGILKNILKEKYSNFPKEKLFDKIGLKNVIFEKDNSGTFIGSSYIYMTPREYAKFGFLYLNAGEWNGEKIITDDWIKFTTTISPALSLTAYYPKLEEDQMSAHWFLNTGFPEKGFKPLWEAAPKDTFATKGHWGQKIWVIPSLDMVICIFADNRDDSFDQNNFLKLIMESLEK